MSFIEFYVSNKYSIQSVMEAYNHDKDKCQKIICDYCDVESNTHNIETCPVILCKQCYKEKYFPNDSKENSSPVEEIPTVTVPQTTGKFKSDENAVKLIDRLRSTEHLLKPNVIDKSDVSDRISETDGPLGNSKTNKIRRTRKTRKTPISNDITKASNSTPTFADLFIEYFVKKGCSEESIIAAYNHDVTNCPYREYCNYCAVESNPNHDSKTCKLAICKACFIEEYCRNISPS
jgi:hypothetical protein